DATTCRDVQRHVPQRRSLASRIREREIPELYLSQKGLGTNWLLGVPDRWRFVQNRGSPLELDKAARDDRGDPRQRLGRPDQGDEVSVERHEPTQTHAPLDDALTAKPQ